MPSTKRAWKCSSAFVAMAASTGREVLLSSHDGEVLEELADRVYCMRDGAVVKFGKVVSAMKKALLTRRSMLALFGCAVTGLAGMRVSVVNGNRTVIPEKYYAEGEWLSMDGAFLGSKDVATDGYSFCIDGAELLTPREYLKRAHDDYSKYGIVDTKTKLKDATSRVLSP